MPTQKVVRKHGKAFVKNLAPAKPDDAVVDKRYNTLLNEIRLKNNTKPGSLPAAMRRNNDGGYFS